MPNKYSSTERRMWAKKAVANAIALPLPPADLVITNGNGFTNETNMDQLVEAETGVNEISVNKNVIIKAVGIYSNFADGLVAKDINSEMAVRVTAFGYAQGALVPGAITVVPGSTTVNGVATTFSALTPGELIYDPVTGQGLIVQSIATDILMTVRNVPRQAIAGGAFYKTTPASGDVQGDWPVQNLNEMIAIDQFMTPAVFASATSVITVLFARIIVTGATLNTYTWLTKSIDTAFSGDPVTLDIALDIEY